MTPSIARQTSIAAVAMLALACHARDVEAPAPEPSSALEEDPEIAAMVDTPVAVLREGAVEFIQAALKEKGYELEVTGKLDEPTTKALLAFQEKENLARTGLPDAETVRRLGLEPEALFAGR